MLVFVNLYGYDQVEIESTYKEITYVVLLYIKNIQKGWENWKSYHFSQPS